MPRPISCAVAGLNVRRSTPISRNAASCWSIRHNRLVADTLEREWNDKLRTLAEAREEREQARQRDQVVLDEALRQRLATLTTDFRTLWDDPARQTATASVCSPPSLRMPRCSSSRQKA